MCSSDLDVATDVVALMSDDEAARLRLAELHRAITEHTWQRFSGDLIDFFQQILAMPTVLTSTVSGSTASDAMLASIMASRTWRAAQRLQRVRQRLRPRR